MFLWGKIVLEFLWCLDLRMASWLLVCLRCSETLIAVTAVFTLLATTLLNNRDLAVAVTVQPPDRSLEATGLGCAVHSEGEVWKCPAQQHSRLGSEQRLTGVLCKNVHSKTDLGNSWHKIKPIESMLQDLSEHWVCWYVVLSAEAIPSI